MKILAAVVREDGAPPTLEPLELDEPLDSEILVRLVATGICHTDLKAREQSRYAPKPAVLGHEALALSSVWAARCARWRLATTSS